MRPSWPAGIGIATLLSVVAPSFLTGAVVVQMRGDFAFSDTALGIAIGLSYAVAAITSWPAGRLVDRVGPVAGVQLGAGLACACSAAIALGGDSALAVIALLTLAGMANAVGVPGAAVLVRHHLDPSQQGFGIGVQQAGAPAGALLAGLAVPLVATSFGWQAAFGLAAAFALATALAATPLRRREGRHARGSRPAGAGEGLRQARRLAAAAALGNTAVAGMVAFLVSASVRAGASAVAGAIALALASFGAVVARIGLGIRFDRVGGQILKPVPMMLAAGAVGLALCATQRPAPILVGAVAAGTLGWGWSGLTLLAAIEGNADGPGAAAGIVMTGVYVGAAAGPIVFGVLADHAGFPVAWLTAAALALTGSGVALIAREYERAPAAPPELLARRSFR
jgi:MFS family permease